MKYILSFSTVLLLALFMAGCDNSNDPAPTPPPKVTAVHLDPTAVTLDVGTSDKFQAFAVDENGDTTDVTDQASWSLVNNNNTVELDATDPSMVKALAVGNDSVTASYGGVTSDPATVTVVEEALVSLAITPANVTMVVSTTQIFTAEGTYNTGRVQDLTDESIWKSDNAVFVSMDGNIATADKQTDTANITASLEGITSPAATVATFDVILRLEIQPDVNELFEGQTQRYQALAYFASSSEPQDLTNVVTWRSDTLGVIDSVFPDGTSQLGYFRAWGTGTATITASHRNTINDTISDNKAITVLAFFLDRIEIRPETTSIKNGETQIYSMFAIMSDDTEYSINDDPSLKMTVSDGNLAYIEKNANFWELTATDTGTVIVRAQFFDTSNGSEFNDEAGLVIVAP